MLTKSDCLSILVKMGDSGVDISPYMRKLAISTSIPTDVLEFIAKNKGIEAINFYEMLRKKHNKDKSPLYTNILKGDEAKQDKITTLVCLLTQIVLYSNKLESLAQKDQFLKEVRAEEITRVLNTYFKTGEIDAINTVLDLIKVDLLVLEGLVGRREIQLA